MKLPVLLVAAILVPSAVGAADISRETFGSGGRSRTYYLYVPETIPAGTPAPLIVFLHGSGRNGLILVEKWKDLAKKEGIILAGPDALNSQYWHTNDDGPDLIHDLVDIVGAGHPVDPRRVYLFGHSAGAIHALMFGVLESQYFAAVAAHAGALPAELYAFADSAPRKIPFAIWVGTEDPLFPVLRVRETRDALVKRGFAVELTEIPRHTHDYYSRSSEINKAAWAFLKSKALTEDPVFTKYEIQR